MSEHFEFAVIGAGIIGSATAYQLANRSKKTLLIDQFPINKNKGSSQGRSRIIRNSYQEEFFAELMPEAFSEWHKIEKESRKKIYKKTGLLSVDAAPFEGLHKTEANLKKFNIKHKVLEPDELKSRFPSLNYPNYKGLYEDDGGILKADVALNSLQQLFKKNGGTISENNKVIKLILNEDHIRLKTNRAEYRANKVIVCCGPWSPVILDLLGLKLPLEPQRTAVFYWKEREPASHSSDTFPVIRDLKTMAYAIPSFEFLGLVKLSSHCGKACNPDVPDQSDWKEAVAAKTKDYVAQHWPGLDPTVANEEFCFYTVTPDKVCVLDHHPTYPNIVIGTGFSGTGFKLAPVVGNVLSDMAENKTPKYDLAPFRMERLLRLNI